MTAEFPDLVSLDINSENPDEYRVSYKWKRVEHLMESITVKDEKSQLVDVKRRILGLVTTQPLLDEPVVIYWTALDHEAINIGLIDLEQTETLEQAVNIVNHTGGQQLNFLLADKSGNIAWTIMGRIPKRNGSDGSVSRSWVDGAIG